MNSFLCLAVTLLIAGASADDKVKCKGEDMKDMKAMWKTKLECLKEAHPEATTPAPGKKIDDAEMKKWIKELNENMCISVCDWKKRGLLKDDGTYDAAGTETNIKAMIPEKAVADMKKAMDDCATETSKDWSMDNKCAGYRKFAICQTKKFVEVCEIKKPE